MEKYLQKPVKGFVFVLMFLSACSDQDDCRNRPVYNHELAQADHVSLAMATLPAYRFIHAINGTITDTIELTYTGTDTKKTSLQNLRMYSEHSDECSITNYDNIDTRKSLYIDDRAKKTSLLITLMAARVNYTNYYWSNTYTLDKRKYLEVKWNTAVFSCFPDELQGDNIRYVQSITKNGRTFTDVYFFETDSAMIYLNKSSIAHIMVSNETWTSF